MRFLQDFEPLLPAERMLLGEVATGGTCWLATSRPRSPSGENEVRAAFVRFLALGGGARAPVHESGVRLKGAYINGAINLDGAGNVRPLWLQDCTISSLFSLFDARTKVISLDGSSVQAIRGDRVKIDGSLLLRQGFVCEGAIRLSGAEIDGTLACEGGRIEGAPRASQRLAIDLATATVNGNVEFSKNFTANGLIWLDDAEIGGLFDCTGGRFFAASAGEPKPAGAEPWEPGVRALKCHRLALNGGLYLRGARCEGEISFSGAGIGGDIDCSGGRFHATEDGENVALRFTRVTVGGNVYLSGGFDAFGKVQFNGARIGGNIDCRGGVFTIPENIAATDLAATREDFSEDALSLVNARCGGALLFAPIERGGSGEPATFNGSVDLKGAHAFAFVDDVDAWPKPPERGQKKPRNVIHLDGFTYERFGGSSPTEADVRKRWLERQPSAHLRDNFKPQPFEQLIKVLRAMGYPEQARRLSIERQGYLIRRRLRNWKKRPLRAAGALISFLTVGLLIGHGYRPLRVLVIMGLVGALCGFYFKIAAEQAIFAPRDPQMFLAPGFDKCRPAHGGNWALCGDPNRGVGLEFAEYPQFNPWIYSFDALLPVFDLKQQTSWWPIQKPVTLSLSSARRIEVPAQGTQLIVLFETLFGWLGSLLAVAAFSGLVKND